MAVVIALLLALDGVANGAVCVLVALRTVLIFVVPRVSVVPFGVLVAYAAVALDVGAGGSGRLFCGPEGCRAQPLTRALFEIGGMIFPGQMLVMLAGSALISLLLFGFFGRTLSGKALRATAVNRIGARLVGIRPATAGAFAFLVASALAGVSGILIGPVTTLYYDSGFVIGLKAFFGAIIGGLVSYPLAALGALLVGLLSSYPPFSDTAPQEVGAFCAPI